VLFKAFKISGQNGRGLGHVTYFNYYYYIFITLQHIAKMSLCCEVIIIFCDIC